MGIISYKNGKNWEDDVIDFYNKKGCFVYKIPTLIEGTVFDILVVKNASCMAIECKHVKGDKLSYVGCGLKKKRDEIEHFVRTSNTNLYIFIKSDKLNSIYWTTWERSKKVLEEKGHLDLDKDCFKAVMYDGNNNI